MSQYYSIKFSGNIFLTCNLGKTLENSSHSSANYIAITKLHLSSSVASQSRNSRSFLSHTPCRLLVPPKCASLRRGGANNHQSCRKGWAGAAMIHDSSGQRGRGSTADSTTSQLHVKPRSSTPRHLLALPLPGDVIRGDPLTQGHPHALPCLAGFCCRRSFHCRPF